MAYAGFPVLGPTTDATQGRMTLDGRVSASANLQGEGDLLLALSILVTAT